MADALGRRAGEQAERLSFPDGWDGKGSGDLRPIQEPRLLDGDDAQPSMLLMGVQRNKMKSRYAHDNSGRSGGPSRVSCGVSAVTDDSGDFTDLSEELKQQVQDQGSKSVDQQLAHLQQQTELNQLLLYQQMLQNAQNQQRESKKKIIIKREVNQGFSLKNLERILHKSFKLNRQKKDRSTQTGQDDLDVEDGQLLFTELESIFDKKTFIHTNEQLSNGCQQ